MAFPRPRGGKKNNTLRGLLLKPRSHSRMKSCECALITNVNGYSSIRSVIRHSRTTENKVKFGQLFCEYCYSQFIRTINSIMWTFIRHSQKFINTMLSIPVMEGIVFVYIFKAISFAGHLNEHSQFACLQQLIRCFLFANVNSLNILEKNMTRGVDVSNPLGWFLNKPDCTTVTK